MFNRIEYPSKEVRDAVNATMMADSRMKALGDNMLCDSQRMIFGGFLPLPDEYLSRRPFPVEGDGSGVVMILW